MDPFLVLNLSRDCTRREVKRSFRAKVQLEHPDRGGEEQAFIRICTAYKQVLAELDRAEPDRRVDAETYERAANQTLVDILQKVSARSIDMETKSRRGQSAGPRSNSQVDSGAAIAGIVALIIFIAEVLSVVLTDGGSPAVPAAAIQVEDDSRRTTTTAEHKAMASHQEPARTTTMPGPGRPPEPRRPEPDSLLPVPYGASLNLAPLEWNR
jgi:curved DNA-binding protein CbpA